MSENSPVSENIVLLSESLSENVPLSANSSLSENAPLSENASLPETVSSSPQAHFGSLLERQLQQGYFGSPSANSSVVSDNNDLLDTDISEKMKSKSCNESSTDPARKIT